MAALVDTHDDRIRVMRIIARMNVGGPAIQVCAIAQGLPSNEFNQILLTGSCEPGETDYLELNAIQLSRVKLPELRRSINLLSDLKALLFIRRQLLTFKPEILHTHTFKAGFLGRVAALTTRIPMVKIHTFHGHLLDGYLKGLKFWILIKIERFLATKTNVLVTVGNKVMTDLIASGIGKTEQYLVIPPGFPMEYSMESEAKARNFKERKAEFRCVWVGRLVEIKRPDRLIEISRILKERNSGILISVIGDGPMRKELEAKVIRELLPVEFLGWQQNVHAFISQADVLILTSANEGTPLSIIEAQRLGKPVVATNVGSVSEILSHGKSGFILEFDAMDFAEKLEILRGDNDMYLQFSKYAKDLSSKRFLPERLVADHARLYKNSIYRH